MHGTNPASHLESTAPRVRHHRRDVAVHTHARPAPRCPQDCYAPLDYGRVGDCSRERLVCITVYLSSSALWENGRAVIQGHDSLGDTYFTHWSSVAHLLRVVKRGKDLSACALGLVRRLLRAVQSRARPIQRDQAQGKIDSDRSDQP